jgi:alpha-tubulin suppressor-like RCC1 family protein
MVAIARVLRLVSRLAVLASLDALLFTACNPEKQLSPTSGPAFSMQIVSGDLQSAPAGAELLNPLVVKVVDAAGRAVGGQLVNFRVTSGSGSVFAGSSLTDIAGIAQERWRLGTNPADSQRVEARAVDNATGAKVTFAIFKALVKPGPPVATVIHAINRTSSAFAAYIISIGPDGAHTSIVVEGNLDPESLRQSKGWGPVCYATQQATGERHFALLGLVPGSSADRSLWTGSGPWADSLARGILTLNQFLARFGSDLVASTAAFDPVPLDSWSANLVRWTWTAPLTGSSVVTFTQSDSSCPISPAAQPPATQLAFAIQPSNAFLGGGPYVRVAVQDASGNTVRTATSQVTVAIGTNPTGAALSGTTTMSAGNGFASFSDLVVGKAGNYTLTASATGLTGTASTAFNIVAFASVSVGGESTCGLTTGSAAYCWGYNSLGELGNGTSSFTANTAPVAVSGTLTLTAVSIGAGFACGIAPAAAAYCWGFNGQDNLGVGPSTGPQRCVGQDLNTGQPAWCSTVPLSVAGGLTFSAVSPGGLGAFVHPGNSSACGVSASGAGYCWGGNGSGQLGNGTFTGSSIPVAVAGGLTFTTVSVGRDHTCSVTASGAAYCWGSDCAGQLGDGKTGSSCSGPPGSNVPVPVSGGLSFRTVSASVWNWFTCGVTTSGAAYCWGQGWLGDGKLSAATPTPVAVAGGLTFAMVSAGNYHSCGVTASGAAYCWGENTYGQIGSGMFTTAATPAPVTGGLTFAMVSAGGNSTCGVTTAGAAYCWGGNEVGELGNGTVANSNVPVAVRGVP